MVKFRLQTRGWLLLAIVILFAAQAKAAVKGEADFHVNGIYYKYIGADEVQVDFQGTIALAMTSHGCYSGDIIIPATVEDNSGKTLTVSGIGAYAFYMCPIKSIVLPNTITYIGIYAFRGCADLKELVLPSSLRTIGGAAFAECGIQSLQIPNGVTELTNFLFRSSSLSQITLPSTIKSIGKETFYQSKITEIFLPSGVEEIGEGAFAESPLTTINLPTTLKTIGDRAFQYTKVSNLAFPEGLTTIGANAFQASKLTQITLSTSVESIGVEAFRDCVDLQTVVMSQPGPMSIPKRAFYGCTSLDQISTIPDGVQSIEEEAFMNCSSLQAINFGTNSQLKTIGIRAFKNTQLSFITIPSATESIENWAFQEISTLESLTFASNSQLKSIGDNAFQKTSVKSAILPEGLESMGAYAFSYCASLTNVTIPSTLLSIEQRTFEECTSLETVSFPKTASLKSIGNCVFQHCQLLQSLSFPEGLEVIGESVYSSDYYNHGALAYVYIPSTIVSIGSNAFIKYDNEAPHDITFDLESPIESVGNNAFTSAGRINIKHYDNWIRLVCNSFPFSNSSGISYGYFAHIYYNDELLTDYVIPNDITSIRKYAFSGNTDIQSIVFPNTLETIGEKAFYGCSSLESVTFGEGIKSLDLGAFQNCAIKETNVASYDSWIKLVLNSSTASQSGNSEWRSTFEWKWFPDVRLNGNPITEYTIPEEFPDIRENAFAGNSQMTSIKFPNSLKTIGMYAFYKCTGLQTVTFVTPPESIGHWAFWGCTLKTVDIGDIAKWCSVNFIHNGQVYDNKIYSNPFCVTESPKIIVKGKTQNVLAIPSGVTAISSHAFWGCQRFAQVYIPNSVRSIGDRAFFGCSDFASVKFGNRPELESIGAVSFAYSGLYSIELPNSVNSIGPWIFEECRGLTSVVLSNNIQEIPQRAFMNCTALQSLDLPSSLNTIGPDAFYGCEALVKLNISDLATWCNMSLTQQILTDARHLYLNEERLTDLVIPEGVTSISDFAFAGSSDLVSVTVPEGVTIIGKKSFYNCHNIQEVHIPASIESIGESAFLSSPNGLPKRPKHDFNLYLGSMENYINACGDNAFKRDLYTGYFINLYLNNERVKDLVIPEGITSLASANFYGTSIRSATLPFTLENIAKDVFQKCMNLQFIISKPFFAPTSTGNGLILNNTKAIYILQDFINHYKGKWPDNAAIIKGAPDEMILDDDQDFESIIGSMSAYSILNETDVTYVDLSGATLGENVTAEALNEAGKNSNIIYYMPTGSTITGTNIVVDNVAEQVEFNNKWSIAIPREFSTPLLSYTHQLEKRNGAYTLCLPYDYILPDGLEAFTLAKGDASGNLMFEKVESGIIEANKPYLVKASQDINNLNASNVAIRLTESINAGIEGYEFVGTLSAISATDAVSMGAYVISDNNEWLPVTEESEGIKPGTAYLIPTSSSPNKIKSFLIGGNTLTPTVKNAMAILSYILGENPDGFDVTAADLNGDGKVTITDASILIVSYGLKP